MPLIFPRRVHNPSMANAGDISLGRLKLLDFCEGLMSTSLGEGIL